MLMNIIIKTYMYIKLVVLAHWMIGELNTVKQA